MCPDIEQQPSARSRVFFPRTCSWRRPPSVKARFEAYQPPEALLTDYFLNCSEVRVPPAVMERRQNPVACARNLHQLRHFGCSHARRLVDHHVPSRLQRLLRRFEVVPAGRRHHDQLNGLVFEQRCQRPVNGNPGVPVPGLVGAALYHGSQLQPFHRRHQRRVKHASAQPESNHANSNHAVPPDAAMPRIRSVSLRVYTASPPAGRASAKPAGSWSPPLEK